MIQINRFLLRLALVGVVLSGVWSSPLLHAQELFICNGATANNNTVRRYNGSTGAFIDLFVPIITHPTAGMTFGPDGNLYVTTQDLRDRESAVLRYNGTTGAFMETFVSSSNPFHAASFGPDGNLYVGVDDPNATNNSEIRRYNGTTGAFIDTFIPAHRGGLLGVFFQKFGPDGNLYVVSHDGETGGGEILRYNGQTGAFLGALSATVAAGNPSPVNLAFGPDGNLYVNYYQDNIRRFNIVTGAFMGTFVPTGSGGLSRPLDMTFGPDGNLYVTNLDNNVARNYILRYNGMTGVFMDVFVAAGSGGMAYVRWLAFRPIMATISGTITLEDIVPNASPQLLTLTFRPADNSDDIVRDASVGPTGTFSVTDLPRKTYTLHIKGSKWLAKNIPVNASNGDITGVTATLRAGDATNDNSVDVLDLDALIQAFDSATGDLNWNNGRTDFNCDGSVDVLDLDLLIRNFDQEGDP